MKTKENKTNLSNLSNRNTSANTNKSNDPTVITNYLLSKLASSKGANSYLIRACYLIDSYYNLSYMSDIPAFLSYRGLLFRSYSKSFVAYCTENNVLTSPLTMEEWGAVCNQLGYIRYEGFSYDPTKIPQHLAVFSIQRFVSLEETDSKYGLRGQYTMRACKIMEENVARLLAGSLATERTKTPL